MEGKGERGNENPNIGAINRNTTRCQALSFYHTELTGCTSVERMVVCWCECYNKSLTAWLKRSYTQIKGRDLRHTHAHTALLTAQCYRAVLRIKCLAV